MSFIWPPMLLTLLLIPLGLGLYASMGGRRRRRLVHAYGPASVSPPERRRHPGRVVPPFLLIAAFVVMGMALARPQAVVSLPRQEGIVILAFDVSDSMAATDVSPSRIAAARTAAKDFVANQPTGISIGVVAFSDSGVSTQTPTSDQGELLSAIDRLTPQKGTSLSGGITASLNAITAAERGPYANNGYYSNASAPAGPSPTPVPPGYHAPAVIVLLSDGENNENPDPMSAAQAAADQGVRIYTVGIGSADGADLDVSGVHVHTTLNAEELQQIAQITDGTYYAATDAAQVRSVYDSLSSGLFATPELTELTSVFAGASVLLLLAGALASLLWLGRLS